MRMATTLTMTTTSVSVSSAAAPKDLVPPEGDLYSGKEGDDASGGAASFPPRGLFFPSVSLGGKFSGPIKGKFEETTFF